MMKPHDARAGGRELAEKKEKNSLQNTWSFKHLEPVTEV
jgi:hypothetical protein